MGNAINVAGLNWQKGEGFLHFAFGDFNTKSCGIYRTIEGDGLTINLSPPMQDTTADIPGGDGQYYFGTSYKSKVFDISFAFDNMSMNNLFDLKTAFRGKETKELLLFENEEDFNFSAEGVVTSVNKGLYTAKVTGQPSITIIPFEDANGNTIYKGKGKVQFTAYWPFSRGEQKTPSNNGQGTVNIALEYSGNAPTHFIFTADANVTEVTVGGNTIKVRKDRENEYITFWDSKTGIVKYNSTIIPYDGKGVCTFSEETNAYSKHGKSGTSKFTYYDWYC